MRSDERAYVAHRATLRLQELLALDAPTTADAAELAELLFDVDRHCAWWFPYREGRERLRRFRASLFSGAPRLASIIRRDLDKLRARWRNLARRDPVGFVSMLRDHTAGRAVLGVDRAA